MNFINPKVDFAFKKIFGDEQHKDILISFLNALLYDNQPMIQDLEILNPYLSPKLSGLKDTFLDVKARIAGDKYVIIEMQVLAVSGFAKRVLYNVSKAYAAQLKPKSDYSSLSPVIGLTITDFKMFEQFEDVLSRFVLYNTKNGVEYPIKDIELVFVELPKFEKDLAALQSLAEKWLYFLRYADTMEDVPRPMQAEPALEKAFEIANRVNLTQDELDELEKREFWLRDMQRLIMSAQEAEKRGEKIGLERGEKIGLEKGIEQGKQEKAIAIAIQLFDVLTDELISQKTGLPLEAVKRLRKEMN